MWEAKRITSGKWLASLMFISLVVTTGWAQRQPQEDAFVRMVRHNDGSRTTTAKDASNKQEITTFDKDGNLKLVRRYELNEQGQPTTFIISDGGGTPILRGVFKYDPLDPYRMVQELLYSMDGTLIRRLTQNYDFAGRKTDPTIENFGALPADILYWMDPDSASSAPGSKPKGRGGRGTSRPGGSSPQTGGEKKSFFDRINIFKRNR